jgi:hypothetical protein
MLSLSDVCRSRYLLYRGLCDAGFSAGRAALAVDVLLGPEPSEEPDAEFEIYEPTREDYEDYVSWADRLELPPMGDDRSYLSDRDVLTVLGCVG